MSHDTPLDFRQTTQDQGQGSQGTHPLPLNGQRNPYPLGQHAGAPLLNIPRPEDYFDPRLPGPPPIDITKHPLPMGMPGGGHHQHQMPHLGAVGMHDFHRPVGAMLDFGHHATSSPASGHIKDAAVPLNYQQKHDDPAATTVSQPDATNVPEQNATESQHLQNFHNSTNQTKSDKVVIKQDADMDPKVVSEVMTVEVEPKDISKETEEKKPPIQNNPWLVASAKAFSFYCCPECDYKVRKEQVFWEHAVENHPMSMAFFEKRDPDDVQVKNELGEDDYYDDEDDSDGSDYDPDAEPKKSSKRKKDSYVGDDFVVDEDEDEELFDEYYDEDFEYQPSKKKRKRRSTSGRSRGGRISAKMQKMYEDAIKEEEEAAATSASVKAEPGEPPAANATTAQDKTQVDKPHSCTQCVEKFRSLYALAMHLLVVHSVGSSGCYECPACSFIGPSMAKVKKHIVEYHEGHNTNNDEEGENSDGTPKTIKREYLPPMNLPLHQCPDCNARVKGLYKLANHIRSKHRDQKLRYTPYQCPGCDFTAEPERNGWKKLRNHIFSEHEKDVVPCPTCGKEIARHTLTLHIKNVHQVDRLNKPYKCDKCDFETHNQQNLNQHIKFKHEHFRRKYHCDQCDSKFIYQSGLDKHKETVHMDLRKYVCDKCGKGFREQNLLTSHLEQPSCNFLTSRDKIYSCDECDEEYPVLKSYIAHHRVTHGSFPNNVEAGQLHLCDRCPKIYLSVQGLNMHKRTAHLGKIKRPSKPTPKDKCPFCEKLVPRGNNMIEHIKSKHENNTPFKCDQCTRSFGTEAWLRTHITNTHRRIKCEICAQEICNKFWLKRHMATAHGVTPENCFQCEFCPLVFSTEISKDKHMAKQHG